MNVTATGVTNAANLALFMVHLSTAVLRDVRQTDPACRVRDLKAYPQGYKYVSETIKGLPEKLDEQIVGQIIRQVARCGRIHPAEPYPTAA